MAEIFSRNEQTRDTIKDFFVPSFAAGFLYFLLGGILLVIFAFSQILGWFGNDYLESAHKLNQSFHVFDKGLSSSFDSALGGRLGQALVWSLIGALAYILIWFIKNMLNSVENDIIIDRYTHPENYDRTKFLGVALAELVLFLALVVVLVGFTFLGLKVIMPAAASLLSSSVNHFRLPSSILYLALSIIVPAAAIYFWTLIARLIISLWQRL